MLATALLIVGLCSNVQAHSGDVVAALYGTAPTVDGTISPGEWDDASTVTFSVKDGDCTVYVKQDGSSLYVAFDIPDTTPATPLSIDKCAILLDVDHNDGYPAQTDDLQFFASRDGGLRELHGTGGGWTGVYPEVGWTASASSMADGFQTEYSIPYDKIGVTAGVDKTLGIAFEVYDLANGYSDYWWPPVDDPSLYPSGITSYPSVWADLTSPAPFFTIPEVPSTLVTIALMLTAITAYYTKKRS